MARKIKPRNEYDTYYDNRFCVKCGRKTEEILHYVTYDERTGQKIHHIRRTCPYRFERPWWESIFGAHHSGDDCGY